MKKTFLSVLPAVFALFLTGSRISIAADWPQYRGPNQDGVSIEKINSLWPPAGPKTVWKVENLDGFGSFAVSGGKAFTLTSREDKGVLAELCLALDAVTGKEIWAAAVIPGVKYKSSADAEGGIYGGYGPQSTPTVNEGKVYVYSTELSLCCFEEKTGRELWRVDVVKDHEGSIPQFGNAESPVVEGDLVIVAGGGPGQSIMAFNKNTGKVVWKAEDAAHLYSTPKIATILGERQAVFYMKNDVLGLSVKDGKRLWRSAVTYHNHNCMQPVVVEDKVYCGVGTDGAGVYQVIKEDEGFRSKRLWLNSSKDSALIATAVFKDGYLFGGLSLWGGALKCLEFASGKVVWSKEKLGNGGGIAVGDKLIFLSETGGLIIVEAKNEFKLFARLDKAINGRCYSTPAFSNGRLYLRSRKEGICYDLGAK